MKIAVIGAGLSGLAAAYRMQSAGHEVIVIEASGHAGGRCKMIERDGFIIDTCPEIAASSYRHWLGLVKDIGLEDDIVSCPTVISIPRNGRLYDLDLGKPLSMAFTQLVSWRAKLDFIRGAISLRKDIKAVPPNLLDGIDLDDPHTNAEEIALKAFGREATDYMLDPMLRPIIGTAMSLSSTLLLPYTLAEWTKMITIRGGLQRVPIAVAQQLNVRYNTTVKCVHSNPDNVSIEVTDETGNGETLIADRCLITAQFDDAQRIYPRVKELAGDFGDKLQFLRMLDVKLAYATRPASPASMVMCPFKENGDINVVSLAHNKAPDRAPPGHSLFSIFTEHLEYQRMANMSDDEVTALIAPQIEKMYPELRGHLLFSRVARQPRTSIVPDPGYFRRTRKLWDDFGREPRVHLGGDLFNFGSMEAAVGSGERAAQRLIQMN